MPALTELNDLKTKADAARRAAALDLVVDADAEAAMNDSLDRTGLLVLGEIHGVRQTPQILAALVKLLDISALALEWPEQLTATVDTYRRAGGLDDHDLFWLGDGRLTTGHLALLRDLAEGEPPVGWLAFDTWGPTPKIPGESPWTARDHAMALRVLQHTRITHRTLVAVGNAHASATPTANGIPMGAWLTRERPGLRTIQITYDAGAFYNLAARTLSGRQRLTDYRLHLDDDRLVLDHPTPQEADVPHRPDLFVVGEPTTSY